MRETEDLEVSHSKALGLMGQVKEFGTYPRNLKKLSWTRKSGIM